MEEKSAELEDIEQKLRLLKWDIDRNQINPAMKMKYEALKEEKKKILEQMEGEN